MARLPTPVNVVTTALRRLAYPQLRSFPDGQWECVLQRASSTPFDLIERAGIVAGVVLASLALRPLAAGPGPALVLYVAQFALALPLLFVLVGPFFLRRTRRGLDLELAQRNGGH